MSLLLWVYFPILVTVYVLLLTLCYILILIFYDPGIELSSPTTLTVQLVVIKASSGRENHTLNRPSLQVSLMSGLGAATKGLIHVSDPDNLKQTNRILRTAKLEGTG